MVLAFPPLMAACIVVWTICLLISTILMIPMTIFYLDKLNKEESSEGARKTSWKQY